MRSNISHYHKNTKVSPQTQGHIHFDLSHLKNFNVSAKMAELFQRQ